MTFAYVPPACAHFRIPFSLLPFFLFPSTMASFDIVSKVDPQTLENAVNTAKKELLTRYDLRDTKGGIELNKKENTILLSSENSMRVKALEDILLGRVVKQAPRNVRTAMVAPFALQNESTFYSRNGDLFAWACVVISLLAVFVRWRYRARTMIEARPA